MILFVAAVKIVIKFIDSYKNHTREYSTYYKTTKQLNVY